MIAIIAGHAIAQGGPMTIRSDDDRKKKGPPE
jgi:hypothetical protein